MKVGINLKAMDISASGMSIQRRKMDLVAENIANVETTGGDGTPYQRKFLVVENNKSQAFQSAMKSTAKMKTTSGSHLSANAGFGVVKDDASINSMEVTDSKPGELVYMPEHPDANQEGYVQMPNVNVITEMVDMIAATRGFEANVTAFNAAKSIANESLDI